MVVLNLDRSYLSIFSFTFLLASPSSAQLFLNAPITNLRAGTSRMPHSVCELLPTASVGNSDVLIKEPEPHDIEQHHQKCCVMMVL